MYVEELVIVINRSINGCKRFIHRMGFRLELTDEVPCVVSVYDQWATGITLQ